MLSVNVEFEKMTAEEINLQIFSTESKIAFLQVCHIIQITIPFQ